MVQIADLNAALGPKDATLLFTDGLHPNERGAARIADAILDARKRLTPTSTSPTGNINVSAPRSGPALRPRISGSWYGPEHTPPLAAETPVAWGAVGDLWAVPIWVTQGREFWNRLALTTSAATAAGTIRWGLYDDVGWSGYPCELVNEATAASGALTTGTGGATVLSPTAGNGSFSWVLDPGLYWIGFMIVTAGTGVTWRPLRGSNGVISNMLSTGAYPTTIGAITNGFKLTGQTTTSLPGTFPSGAVATAGAPPLAVQVSAQTTN